LRTIATWVAPLRIEILLTRQLPLPVAQQAEHPVLYDLLLAGFFTGTRRPQVRAGLGSEAMPSYRIDILLATSPHLSRKPQSRPLVMDLSIAPSGSHLCLWCGSIFARADAIEYDDDKAASSGSVTVPVGNPPTHSIQGRDSTGTWVETSGF
jgi:hypothetical protein